MYVVKGHIYISIQKENNCRLFPTFRPHFYPWRSVAFWRKSDQIWSTMNTNMTRKSIDKKRPLEEMRQPSMSSADQPASQSDNNPAFMLLLFPHSFTLACSLYTKWFVCSQYDWQSCWEKELKEVPSPLLLPLLLLLLLLLLQLGSVSYARSETFCKYKVWFIVFFGVVKHLLN